MVRWHRQVVPKGRKYTKHTKRFTDKQRAAYWKKKYLDLVSKKGL